MGARRRVIDLRPHLLVMGHRSGTHHGRHVLGNLLRRLRPLEDRVILSYPDPLPVRPEPEQGAEAGADHQGDVVPELALAQAGQVRQPDASVVDDQADPVEDEKDDAVPDLTLAVAVPERPVPVAQVGEDRGQDRGDRDGFVPADAVQGISDAECDHRAERADDEELGTLVYQMAEPLVEPANRAHLWIPPPDSSPPRGDFARLQSRRLWRAQLRRQITLDGPDIRSELTDLTGKVAGVPEPDILIRAHDLTKRFGDFVAVDGIDFELRRGEAFGFLGPNGAGKSSTMRMIGCVSPPSGGELSILGMNPVTDGPVIRARLGVVAQEDTLDVELTVRENLLVYGRYFGLRRSVIAKRTASLLDFVQLAERAGDHVEPLSGGMKRRLTIARSLINDPEILLLDEPTTGLDPQARHVVWDRLFRLKQQGVTLILTTHYMDEAEQLCDRLVVMDGGKIVAEGSPRELIESYSTPEVLELRFQISEHDLAAEKVANAPAERMEVLADRVLLYVRDGDAALAAVRGLGLEPMTSLVRRSTLEDVFLRLTGRRLEDV